MILTTKPRIDSVYAGVALPIPVNSIVMFSSLVAPHLGVILILMPAPCAALIIGSKIRLAAGWPVERVKECHSGH